jgi:hypothetical protein
MYHTSSIVCWMGFVTVYASDVTVLDFSTTCTSEMVCCTFHTSWCIPAVVFRMSVFLTAHALGYFPFGTWRFSVHCGVQESVDSIYFLIVGVGFDIDKMYR